MEKTITLNEQQVDFLVGYISEDLEEGNGEVISRKYVAIAKQILAKLNEA